MMAPGNYFFAFFKNYLGDFIFKIIFGIYFWIFVELKKNEFFFAFFLII
jgi:hypothetical protein